MKIFRTDAQLRGCPRPCGLGYEIELTPKEMESAYRERQWCYRSMDIASVIDGKITDTGTGDDFAPDWPYRVGEHYAEELGKRIDKHESYNEMYMAIVDELVCEKLKELGFDPDTMKKERT